MTNEHKWDICGLCGPMVVCGYCGNNCCNATYGEVDGETCTHCEEAYSLQEQGPPSELLETKEYQKWKSDSDYYSARIASEKVVGLTRKEAEEKVKKVDLRVRIITPKCITTKDLRTDRVNLEVADLDENTIVTRAWVG